MKKYKCKTECNGEHCRCKSEQKPLWCILGIKQTTANWQEVKKSTSKIDRLVAQLTGYYMRIEKTPNGKREIVINEKEFLTIVQEIKQGKHHD